MLSFGLREPIRKLVAIIGVVTGAMVTGAVNFLIQRAADFRRWQREDQIRFHVDKPHLYRDFLDKVRFARDIRFCDSWMADDMSSLVSEMNLISFTDVSNAAQQLSLTIQRWCETGAASFKGDTEERELALDAAHSDFVKATRRELGILDVPDK